MIVLHSRGSLRCVCVWASMCVPWPCNKLVIKVITDIPIPALSERPVLEPSEKIGRGREKHTSRFPGFKGEKLKCFDTKLQWYPSLDGCFNWLQCVISWQQLLCLSPLVFGEYYVLNELCCVNDSLISPGFKRRGKIIHSASPFLHSLSLCLH